jgi:hypothetical protein
MESFFSILTGKFRPDALVSFNGLSKVNYDDVLPPSLSLTDTRRKTPGAYRSGRNKIPYRCRLCRLNGSNKENSFEIWPKVGEINGFLNPFVHILQVSLPVTVLYGRYYKRGLYFHTNNRPTIRLIKVEFRSDFYSILLNIHTFRTLRKFEIKRNIPSHEQQLLLVLWKWTKIVRGLNLSFLTDWVLPG